MEQCPPLSPGPQAKTLSASYWPWDLGKCTGRAVPQFLIHSMEVIVEVSTRVKMMNRQLPAPTGPTLRPQEATTIISLNTVPNMLPEGPSVI